MKNCALSASACPAERPCASSSPILSESEMSSRIARCALSTPASAGETERASMALIRSRTVAIARSTRLSSRLASSATSESRPAGSVIPPTITGVPIPIPGLTPAPK